MYVDTSVSFVVCLCAGVGRVERGSCLDLLVAVIVMNVAAALWVLWLRSERVPRRLAEQLSCAGFLAVQALIIAAVVARPLETASDGAVRAAQLVAGVGITIVSTEALALSMAYKAIVVFSKIRIVSVAALRRYVAEQMRTCVPERIAAAAQSRSKSTREVGETSPGWFT
jgi:hypothetical protein